LSLKKNQDFPRRNKVLVSGHIDGNTSFSEKGRDSLCHENRLNEFGGPVVVSPSFQSNHLCHPAFIITSRALITS